MRKAPLPPDEAERLSALYALEILDTPPEERFDRITRLAVDLFGVPIAYIAMVDANRQWFKSQCGLNVSQTPRDISFCGHTILQNEPLIIPDATQHPDFHDNPMVTGQPFVRFYAGHPLASVSGHNLGTLCLVDEQPRRLDADQLRLFIDLAMVAESELRLVDVVQLQDQLLDLKRQLEARNEMLRRVFGRYMTDEVAGMLLDDPEALQLGGREQKVTVLMSDLRGFTPMSEKLSPAQVVAALNHYLSAMVDIVMSHGGTITAFIGDAILAVFGAPKAGEDDATRAVACALEMQLAMDEVNANLQAMGLPELTMGIGLNTGPVVAGNIGSEKLTKYSVIGATVNLAARIESFTLGGQILASRSTVDEVGQELRIDGQLRVKVKGIDGPVLIFEIGGLDGAHDIHLPRSSSQLLTTAHLPPPPANSSGR